MTSSSIKSADRVLDVLELLCRRGNSASHAEIAFALDIPKSSLTGLLKNLVHRQYLEKNASENTYLLGPAFFDLIQQGKNVRIILKIAKAQLAVLTEKTREASAFYLFKGDHIERVLGQEANYPLSYRMLPNIKFPLYSAAAGKAILNTLPGNEQDLYLKNTELKPITDKTATLEKDIRKKLLSDTVQGITKSVGENSVGVIALATPICRKNGYPIGAISIVIPEVRFNPSLGTLCRKALLISKDKIETELNT
jgi:DNA-binding IclR family transcriptional regulator